MIPHRLYVGTIGEGLFRSLDQGQTFRRACDGVFVECDVRAVVVHPHRPEVLYLGTEVGLYVSRDGADNWQKLPAPLDGLEVWAISLTAGRPERLVVGVRPASIFLSEDAGLTWREAQTTMRRDCPRIIHTRVTTITVDPDKPDRLWAGVEIDGLHLSEDGGRTWAPLGEGLTSRNIHALVLAPAGEGRAPAGDNQQRSQPERRRRPNLAGGGNQGDAAVGVLPVLAQRSDAPEVVLLGGGDSPPGSEGLVALLRDAGATWQPAATPGRSNSTMWNFAVHPADGRMIYGASVSGQVFRSLDGGASWSKLGREFGEIRGLAWAPG